MQLFLTRRVIIVSSQSVKFVRESIICVSIVWQLDTPYLRYSQDFSVGSVANGYYDNISYHLEKKWKLNRIMLFE